MTKTPSEKFLDMLAGQEGPKPINNRQQRPQHIGMAREYYASSGITCYMEHNGWLVRWLNRGELTAHQLSHLGAMRFLDRFKTDCMEGY